MKNKIAILGSTGSIGKSLIKILKKDKDNSNILLLTANKNYKELFGDQASTLLSVYEHKHDHTHSTDGSIKEKKH